MFHIQRYCDGRSHSFHRRSGRFRILRAATDRPTRRRRSRSARPPARWSRRTRRAGSGRTASPPGGRRATRAVRRRRSARRRPRPTPVIATDRSRRCSLGTFPRVTISSGSSRSISASRYPRQFANSSVVGSRLSGGRHRTQFVIRTSARASPASRSASSSTSPDRPTKGSPRSSSCAPGPRRRTAGPRRSGRRRRRSGSATRRAPDSARRTALGGPRRASPFSVMDRGASGVDISPSAFRRRFGWVVSRSCGRCPLVISGC